jgi:uncharacterized protein YdhG (YjbR/CyaY superfamily)
MKIMSSPKSYIDSFAKDVQIKLNQIRQIILKASKDAEEGVAYGMVGYKLYGRPLIYFAAFKNHIGLYATPSGHKEFAKELEKYVHNKGSVQFPLSQKLPVTLITKIVKFRVKENTIKYKKPAK